MANSDSLRVNRQQNVNALRGAFSPLPVYNHLHNAFYDAGVSWLIPPRSLRWRVPAFLVPPRVHRFVRPYLVVPGLVSSLTAAHAVVKQQRLLLDREIQRDAHPSRGRPYDHLPADLVVVDQETIDGSLDRCYVYNPYTLAMATMDQYARFIIKVLKSNKMPFDQLSLICQKAKSLSGRVEMIVSAM